jgi:hypothetical protein
MRGTTKPNRPTHQHKYRPVPKVERVRAQADCDQRAVRENVANDIARRLDTRDADKQHRRGNCEHRIRPRELRDGRIDIANAQQAETNDGGNVIENSR